MTATTRREHHPATGPYRSPRPVLAATGARTSRHDLGPCPVCGQPLRAGQRVADLPDGRPVHVAGCAGRTTA